MPALLSAPPAPRPATQRPLTRAASGRGVAERLNKIPYFLTINRPDNSLVLAANDKSTVLSFGVSGMGPAELFSLAAKATSNKIYAEMFASDGKRDIPLSNSGVHFGTLFGTGLNPYKLPETLYVDELRRLKISLTDFSGQSNTLRFKMGARRNFNATPDPNAALSKARLEDRVRITYPFWYVPDTGKVTVADGATSEIPITVFPHHDFLLYQISQLATRTDDGTSVNFRYDLVDANTGRSVINAPGDQHYNINSLLWGGSNIFPFRFRVPRLFKAGQRLILFIQNITSGVSMDTWITLGGVHVSVRMWGETP